MEAEVDDEDEDEDEDDDEFGAGGNVSSVHVSCPMPPDDPC